MIAHDARSALLLLLLALTLARLLLVLRVAVHVGAISILGYRAVRRGLGLHVRRRRGLGDVSGLDERAGGCRARPGSHALLGGAGSAVDHRAARASRGGGRAGARLLLLHELLLLGHRRALLGRLNLILLLARDGAHGDVLHALHLLLARIVLHEHLGLDVLEMAGGHGLLLLLGGRSVPGLLPVVVVVHCGRLPGTRSDGQRAAGTAAG